MDTRTKTIIAACTVIIAATVLKMKRKRQERVKKKRAIWSHKRLLRRDAGLGLSSMVMKERLKDPKAFQDFVRMSYAAFSELLDKVSPLITKQNTEMREAISANARLLLTLRFLSTGEKFVDLSYGFRISPSAISIIIPETIEAIHLVLKDDFLKVPQSPFEWMDIAAEFEQKWNFPLCLGAIGGKHIAIRIKKKDYDSYPNNYRGFHSVMLLAIVDANHNFLYVNVGSNGGPNDAAVCNESALCECIENDIFDFPEDAELPGSNNTVPFVFLTDDAFPLTTRMLKPYGESSTDANKIFNYRLSRAHRVVENAFGILAKNFQIFQKDIELSIEKVEKITLAGCALHNFIQARDGFDKKLCDVENIKDLCIENGSWRDEVCWTRLQSCQEDNDSDVEDRKVRDAYSEYFTTNGTVTWQNDAVKKFNF